MFIASPCHPRGFVLAVVVLCSLLCAYGFPLRVVQTTQTRNERQYDCLGQGVTTRVKSPSQTLFTRGGSLLSMASTSSPSSPVKGLLKSILLQGDSSRPVRRGDIATVKYSCYVAGSDSATIPFARAARQKCVVGESAMIEGWDRALRSMCVGERAVVRVVDPELGYGAAGVPPFVPPNCNAIEMDIEVLDSVAPTSSDIDFDSLANRADNTPRSAREIAEAFESRQRAKAEAGIVELEGLEGFIARVQKFYFFGLFEGETGERPPWFLRPSITFPIAFAIVGAAFYISLAGGAISERGAQSKDELDEIILSATSTLSLLQSPEGMNHELSSTTTLLALSLMLLFTAH